MHNFYQKKKEIMHNYVVYTSSNCPEENIFHTLVSFLLTFFVVNNLKNLISNIIWSVVFIFFWVNFRVENLEQV